MQEDSVSVYFSFGTGGCGLGIKAYHTRRLLLPKHSRHDEDIKSSFTEYPHTFQVAGDNKFMKYRPARHSM